MYSYKAPREEFTGTYLPQPLQERQQLQAVLESHLSPVKRHHPQKVGHHGPRRIIRCRDGSRHNLKQIDDRLVGQHKYNNITTYRVTPFGQKRRGLFCSKCTIVLARGHRPRQALRVYSLRLGSTVHLIRQSNNQRRAGSVLFC